MLQFQVVGVKATGHKDRSVLATHRQVGESARPDFSGAAEEGGQ